MDTATILRMSFEIIKSHRVMVVATCGSDGLPWASTLYYAEKGFTLYFNTRNDTFKLRNFLQNPNVGFVIDEQKPTLYLQGNGVVTPLDPTSQEFQAAKALMAIKVPEARVGFSTHTLSKLVPNFLYLTDYRERRKPRQKLNVTPEMLARFAEGP